MRQDFVERRRAGLEEVFRLRTSQSPLRHEVIWCNNSLDGTFLNYGENRGFHFSSRRAVVRADVSLESFRIGSVEGGSWTITEIEPLAPAEIRARFINVYPACGIFHVNETEYVFEGISVKQLANKAALCTSEKRVENLIRLSSGKSRGETYDGSQIIAARCGSDVLVHHLPPKSSLRFSALQRNAPAIGALFSLANDIHTRYGTETGLELFGPDRSGRTQIEKQARLEATAIEIRSGKYDLILPEIPPSRRKDGQSKLSLAMPSPEEAAGPEMDFGEMENREQLGLDNISQIPYPQMARVAHIEGDVKLELAIDTQSGRVLSVVPVSGHPILRAAVTYATSSWVFPHPYFGPDPVPIIVHFKIRCPPIVDSQRTSSVRPRRRQRPKNKPQKQRPVPLQKKGEAQSL